MYLASSLFQWLCCLSLSWRFIITIILLAALDNFSLSHSLSPIHNNTSLCTTKGIDILGRVGKVSKINTLFKAFEQLLVMLLQTIHRGFHPFDAFVFLNLLEVFFIANIHAALDKQAPEVVSAVIFLNTLPLPRHYSCASPVRKWDLVEKVHLYQTLHLSLYHLVSSTQGRYDFFRQDIINRDRRAR